jgi:hypothetical protein
MDLVFPSKRDGWLVVVIWVSVAGMAMALPIVAGAPGSVLARLAFAAILLGSGVSSIWVLYATRYTVGATDLDVRSGPFRWRVPLATITSVTPSKNPLSSPACSLDRLRVAYRSASGRERRLLLSPADKAGFLAAIAARVPTLTLAGDRLVPRP